MGQHFHAKERNTRRVYMETHSAHLLPYSLNPTRKIFWLKKTGRRSECCRNTLCASLYLKPRSHREVVFVLNCFECGEENVSLHDLITHFWRETWPVMSHMWLDSSRWDMLIHMLQETCVLHNSITDTWFIPETNLTVTWAKHQRILESQYVTRLTRVRDSVYVTRLTRVRDSTDSSSWPCSRDSTDSSTWLDWLEFVTPNILESQ